MVHILIMLHGGSGTPLQFRSRFIARKDDADPEIPSQFTAEVTPEFIQKLKDIIKEANQ